MKKLFAELRAWLTNIVASLWMMVALLIFVLGSLAYCTAKAQTHNSPTAEEQSYATAFQHIIAETDTAPEVIVSNILINPNPEQNYSPFANGYLPIHKACVLMVNVYGNDAIVTALFRVGGGISKDIKLRTILAHEYGHCNNILDPAAPHYKDSTHDNELFADMYALAWTQRYHPKDFNSAYKYLAALRLRYSYGLDFHPRADELKPALLFPTQVILDPVKTAAQAMGTGVNAAAVISTVK